MQEERGGAYLNLEPKDAWKLWSFSRKRREFWIISMYSASGRGYDEDDGDRIVGVAAAAISDIFSEDWKSNPLCVSVSVCMCAAYIFYTRSPQKPQILFQSYFSGPPVPL